MVLKEEKREELTDVSADLFGFLVINHVVVPHPDNYYRNVACET